MSEFEDNEDALCQQEANNQQESPISFDNKTSCIRCGEEILPGQLFCPKCGQKVSETEKLTYIIDPGNTQDKDVIWKSSNESIVKVSDGMQIYSGENVEISWTYHPNNGLQVQYSLSK